MINVHVAICDDDKAVRDYITDILNKNYGEDLKISTYVSGEELCKALDEGLDTDLLFLDIELDVMNGIQVADYIRNTLKNISLQIVYISAGDTHCMEMFEAGPLNFLMKPLDEAKVIAQVQKAESLLGKRSKIFEYVKGKDVFHIKLSDILYFESRNHTVRIVTQTGEDSFYGKLSDIISQGQFENFYSIHRCYFVNMDAIKVFKYAEVIMMNGDAILISQSKRSEFRSMQMKRLK